MPRNIRICDIGTKILEFFLVTSTALVISAVWFGPISHTWNFLANPVGWLAAGIDHQDLQAGSGCGAEPR